MAVEKLVPQYLNKDEDERLVKPFEMTDALNVRVSSEEQGTQGIVKNVEGNSSVPAATSDDTIPATGVNRVVGAVSSDASKAIYFFLFNSNENHGIYRYSVTDDNYIKVYEDSVLNFEYDSFIQGDLVINQQQEELLYFTDGRNEPRKINITRATLGGYASEFETGTDYVKELYLSVCKRPPQDIITFEFETDPTATFNNLKESVWQFAYQYVYDDGEVSAISAYSELAVSETHLDFDSSTESSFSTQNNALDITVTNSDGPVTKIRVLARSGNSGPMYQIKELDNSASDTQTFRWLNDGVYKVISQEEQFKLYDAVPRRAKAQVFSNNRLMYGNYIDGFDSVETDVFQYPVYHQGGSDSLSQFSFDFNTEDRSAGTEGATVFAQTRRHFGDVNANWTSITGLDTDGSEFAAEQNPTYEDMFISNQNVFEIDLSQAASQGEDSTIRVRIDIAAGEIAWHPEYNNSNSNFNGDEYILRPITVKDTAGDVVDTSGDTDGLAFMFPRGTGGKNGNAGFRNLRPENNLVFDVDIPVNAWGTKQNLANQIREGLINVTSTIGVQPNGSPIFDDTTQPNDVIRGHTTEARIVNADGTVPDNTDYSKLFVWFQGTVDMSITSTTYNSTEEKILCKLSRTGMALSSQRVVAIRKGTGGTSWHDLIDDIDVYGNVMNVEFDDVNPHNGTYNVVEWLGDRFEVNINDTHEYHQVATKYVSTARATSLDGNISGGGWILTAMRNATLNTASITQAVSVGDAGSFKSAAKHEFGIVYYDHRNRPSSVFPCGSVSTARFGDSRRDGTRNGRTEIDMRILHTPPEYAQYWAPVYTKNVSYETYLQCTVAEAALPRTFRFDNILAGGTDTTQTVVEGLPTSTEEVLFLSMRTLEGKNSSYKELKGGMLDYKYQEGDKLRVIEFTRDGSIQRPYHEFTITGYNYYVDDAKNPIALGRDSVGSEADELNDYRRTGWFLSIRDDKVGGFTASDIALGTDYFSQRCLVEIVRPKRITDNPVYFEIGQKREIVTVGDDRTHGGDRSNSVSPSFSVLPVHTTKFFSTQRLYRGDKVEHANISTSGHVFVEQVIPVANGFEYKVHPSNLVTVPQNPATLTNATVNTTVGSGNSIFPGVITLDKGDCYLRVREQLIQSQEPYTVGDKSFGYDPSKPEGQSYDTFFVEDESVNDFFPSKSVSIGRPFIEDPEASEVTRSTSVTYSEPFVLESSRLNLSSFNHNLFPFKDYSTKYGEVTYLQDAGESVYVMQEKKCAIQPVSRTLIESAGDGQLVTSSNVLGTETYFAGMFGPGRNPESVSNRFGKTYFVDVEAGKVLELSSNGIVPISDKSMSSYFKDVFASAVSTSTRPRIPTGIDPDNDEFVVTVLQLGTNNVSVDGTVVGIVPRPPENLGNAEGLVTPEFSDGGITKWDNDHAEWDDAISSDMNWNVKGFGTVYLHRLAERDGVFLSKGERAKNGNITVDVVTRDRKHVGVGAVSLTDFTLSVPASLIKVEDGTTVSTSVVGNESSELATIAWSTTKEFWLTNYSFTPELYANIHNLMFSFYNGQIYKHNDASVSNNNFYGTQYNSVVECVSKQNPSMIKVYNAISLEGDDNWEADITNSTQETDVTTAMYEIKEGLRYSVIPKDNGNATSDSSGSNIIVLGRGDSVSGASNQNLTFNSRVSNLPFGIGDDIRILNASSTTATNLTIVDVVDRNTLELSGNASGLVGYIIIAISEAIINADHMRDYYAKVKLTNTNTADVELYAVNMVFTPSPLHNEQQQN